MTLESTLKRVLAYGGLLALAIALVGGVLGFVFAGANGLVSALVGTAMAFVFLAVTAASVILATRVSKGQGVLSGAFLGIVLGGWLIKFIVFLVLVFVLGDQPWVAREVLFLSIVAGVVGSLVVDLVVIARARIPYVDLPPAPGSDGADPRPDRRNDD